MDDDIRYGASRGRGWVPVTHGVQVRADLADDLATNLRTWQMALPFWASFTGVTAARLRGWWVPPLPRWAPHFVAGSRSERVRRPGLDVCRHDELPPWVLIKGVRVCQAAETVLACARDLSLLDVVLIGDAALHCGDLTHADLEKVARLRRRGSPLLRRAIPLMDGRAESIYEGLLRMLHLACGVSVEPQYEVVGSDGAVLARADLRLTGTDRLAEYDGADHLARPRQRRDLRRAGRLSDAGFDRRGYTKEDVLQTPLSVLRDADRALGREHDPHRIQTWYGLLRDSLFTAAGQHRLRVRLGLAEENADKSVG